MERSFGNSLHRELKLIMSACQSGDLRSAEGRVDGLLQTHPDDADVRMAKGMVLMYRGDRVRALDWLTSSLTIGPDNTEGLAWAAYLSLNLGRPEQACAFGQRFSDLDPGNPRAHYLLASALRALGRTEEAVASIDRSLELKPEDTDSLVLKARLLKDWKLPALAEEFYRKAVETGPCPPAAIDLAQILLKASRPDEALGLLQNVAPLLPDAAKPYDLIAQACTETQRFEEADEYWSLAERFSRDRGLLLQNRAKSEIAVGRFEVAEELLKIAIDENLLPASNFLLLTTARKMSTADLPLAEHMKDLLAGSDLSERETTDINYGLAKTFDDLKEFESAIRYADEANRLAYENYSRGTGFNKEGARAHTDYLIRYFTKDRIRFLAKEGRETELPLFVVGMIRSGTTLTENILSAHSKIQGGGEQPFWTDRAPEVFRWGYGASDFDYDLAKRFGDDYLSLIQPQESGILRVVDKNPTNVWLSAVLHPLYPDARIVHLKRHPVDNVLSIWMTSFGHDTNYLSNRENLVFAYQEYMRLFQHLKGVLPDDRFATFSYEDLTSSPEPTIRAMLAHAGVDPEPACFQPEKTARAVLTPSVRQVRQPINRDSQARWKNYEPWLKQFSELLVEEG